MPARPARRPLAPFSCPGWPLALLRPVCALLARSGGSAWASALACARSWRAVLARPAAGPSRPFGSCIYLMEQLPLTRMPCNRVFPRPALVAAGFLAVASHPWATVIPLPWIARRFAIRRGLVQSARFLRAGALLLPAQSAGVSRRYSPLSFCRGFPHFRFPLSLGYSFQAPR